jgi:hypothetical protein
MAAQIGVEGRITHVQNAREGHTGIQFVSSGFEDAAFSIIRRGSL